MIHSWLRFALEGKPGWTPDEVGVFDEGLRVESLPLHGRGVAEALLAEFLCEPEKLEGCLTPAVCGSDSPWSAAVDLCPRLRGQKQENIDEGISETPSARSKLTAKKQRAVAVALVCSVCVLLSLIIARCIWRSASDQQQERSYERLSN